MILSNTKEQLQREKEALEFFNSLSHLFDIKVKVKVPSPEWSYLVDKIQANNAEVNLLSLLALFANTLSGKTIGTLIPMDENRKSHYIFVGKNKKR